MFLIWDKGFQESTIENILYLTIILMQALVSRFFYKFINLDLKVGLKESTQVFMTMFLFLVLFAFYFNLTQNSQLNFIDAFQVTFKTFMFPMLIIFTVLIFGIGTYVGLKKVILMIVK